MVTFGFSVADLILGGTNIVAENSLQKKLQDVYYNMDVDEPETAVGKVTRLLTEYGVGGSLLFKIVNRFRKLPRVKKLLSGIPSGTGNFQQLRKELWASELLQEPLIFLLVVRMQSCLFNHQN